MTRFALAALAALALTGCYPDPVDRGLEPYTGRVQLRRQPVWPVTSSALKRLSSEGWRLTPYRIDGDYLLIKE